MTPAFLSALVFGWLATAGLVAQRLSHGASTGVWLALASSGCAAQLLVSARRALAKQESAWTAIHGAHLLGATIGVMSVHVWVRATFAFDDVLVESPAQFVNDAVLVGCVLALAWAVLARDTRMRVVWFVVALLPCFAYVHTISLWHCDHFEGLPVQRYVISQLTAAFDAAVALAVYLATARKPA